MFAVMLTLTSHIGEDFDATDKKLGHNSWRLMITSLHVSKLNTLCQFPGESTGARKYGVVSLRLLAKCIPESEKKKIRSECVLPGRSIRGFICSYSPAELQKKIKSTGLSLWPRCCSKRRSSFWRSTTNFLALVEILSASQQAMRIRAVPIVPVMFKYAPSKI